MYLYLLQTVIRTAPIVAAIVTKTAPFVTDIE